MESTFAARRARSGSSADFTLASASARSALRASRRRSSSSRLSARSALSKATSSIRESTSGSADASSRRGTARVPGAWARWFMNLGETISTPAPCSRSIIAPRSFDRVEIRVFTSVSRPATR